MQRSRLIQLGCLLLVLCCLAAGGLLQESMYDTYKQENKQFAEDLRRAQQVHPSMAMLTAMPGAVRALASNFLWIRSQTLHQEGKHFDAQQLAEMICALQPYQPGVWTFQAWNMAWNISVMCHTRDQRWHWVYRGVKLLRDKAISRNPKALILYKELSWIFFSKMGGRVDEMHQSYKQRWAGMMQRLLGAPPYLDSLSLSLDEQTKAIIAAFESIANAPLDRDPVRQGQTRFQSDMLAKLLEDPDIAAYAKRLVAMGVPLNDAFLKAYNTYSNDPGITAAKPTFVQPWKTDVDKAAAALLNETGKSGEVKRAREAILAFVRAQILWNQYRMDPVFMHGLMKKYNVPLDWRHVKSHALYWAALGRERCKGLETNFLRINNNRNVLNALKDLTSAGMLSVQWQRNEPDYPLYIEMPDLRYIEATHQQHIEYAREELTLTDKEKRILRFDFNSFADGHVNYLIKAIDLLVADGRVGGLKPKLGTAQYYYDYIRRVYKRRDSYWVNEDVRDFVIAEMASESMVPRYEITSSVLTYSIRRALVERGVNSNKTAYRKTMAFVKRLYTSYQSKAAKRNKMLPLDYIIGDVMANLLYRPVGYGLRLNADERSDIYLAMSDQPRIQAFVYIRLEQFLKALCYTSKKEMKVAFPPPAGLESYRIEFDRAFKRPAPKTSPR